MVERIMELVAGPSRKFPCLNHIGESMINPVVPETAVGLKVSTKSLPTVEQTEIGHDRTLHPPFHFLWRTTGLFADQPLQGPAHEAEIEMPHQMGRVHVVEMTPLVVQDILD